MKDGKIPDDFFKDKIDYCGLEDNIYNQLARTMARNVDIDFAKTPIIDILTGYTRYREAEKKIEQLENIRKEVIERLNNIIDTMLEFSFFKEECPLNFGFGDKKEEKAQDVFFEDNYCEENCNDIYKKCWLKYFEKLQKLKEK